MAIVNHATSGCFLGLLARYPAAGMTSSALNAAANRVAYGVMLNETKTLSKVLVYFSGTTGSPTAAGCGLTLRADASGIPNSSAIESKTLAGAPSGAGWYEFTGFNTSLTKNTQYWLVLANGTATPASNYFTAQFFASSSQGAIPHMGGAGSDPINKWGWPWRTSTNSGSTYPSGGSAGSNIRLEFSDGTFEGFPIQALGLDSTNVAYAAREVGVQFTLPAAWPIARVIGFSMPFNSVGSPGALRYRYYTGSSPALQATTDAMAYAAAPVGSEGHFPLYFDTVQKLYPGSICTFTAGVTSGGDASNYHRSYFYTIQNSAASKALMPFGGCSQAYLNSTWTITNTLMPAFSLILDPSMPFEVARAGCGGVLRGGINPGRIY